MPAKKAVESETTAIGPRKVWFGVVSALILAGLLVGLRINIEYQRTMSGAKDQLMAQARAVNENLGVNLSTADLLLDNTIEMLNVSAGRSADDINAFLSSRRRRFRGSVPF